MNSLSSRLLISVSVLLLLFFGATIAVLDRAFTEAGEQARRDILDGHLVALLAAAEPDDSGELVMPDRLREPRFERIGSGLYAELRNLEGKVLWRSRSALGLEVPEGTVPELGNHLFGRESFEDGTPLLTLSLAVDWELDDGDSKSYVFKVAESLDGFNAQIAGFRKQLFGWFAAVAFTMLLAFSMLLRGLLKPLRQIETEITEIEEGDPVVLGADRHHINYQRLDGDIGVVVNGAGLALATIDSIVDAGGRPANFMDVRTTATSLDVAYGLELIVSNAGVRSILVNVHGGGMQRCDTIAEGLGVAIRKVERHPPLVIRMAGNNAIYAHTVLANNGVAYQGAENIAEAARLAVVAAQSSG